MAFFITYTPLIIFTLEEIFPLSNSINKTNISIKNREVSFLIKLSSKYPAIDNQIDIFEEEYKLS